MRSSIWDTLGIELTTDKKVIQQAYAEKLKIYHPEENPEEFQHLQEAYRSAIKYAKQQVMHGYASMVTYKPAEQNIVIENTDKKEADKPLFPFQLDAQEVEAQKPEAEQIPDYIAKMGEKDVHEYDAGEIKKYVKIFKEQLRTKKGEENLDLLVSLFDSINFRNILAMDQFLEELESEMATTHDWNHRAIDILLARINHIKREESDKDYKKVVKYLESKKGLTSAHIVILCILAFIIRGLINFYRNY